MSATRWCYTLNNPSPDESTHIADLGGAHGIIYHIFGREVGDSGTPHLQGFVIFRNRKTLASVKSIISARLHLETTRASNQAASDYCKKDGDFVVYGTIPSDSRGNRSDWDAFKEWVVSIDRVPSNLEVAGEFPSLFARYPNACSTIAASALPRPQLVPEGATLRPWQQDLHDLLADDTDDDRCIQFFVDENGNSGKSWFCRYMLQNYPEKVQMLGIGRVTDMAYLIDPEKSIYLIDVERSACEFLQYRVLEQLKNRLVMSTKYTTAMKILRKVPHVIVFSNETPDRTKLSRDRYEIINLRTI